MFFDRIKSRLPQLARRCRFQHNHVPDFKTRYREPDPIAIAYIAQRLRHAMPQVGARHHRRPSRNCPGTCRTTGRRSNTRGGVAVPMSSSSPIDCSVEKFSRCRIVKPGRRFGRTYTAPAAPVVLKVALDDASVATTAGHLPPQLARSGPVLALLGPGGLSDQPVDALLPAQLQRLRHRRPPNLAQGTARAGGAAGKRARPVRPGTGGGWWHRSCSAAGRFDAAPPG